MQKQQIVSAFIYQSLLLHKPYMYCGINKWVYFQEKSTLCNNFIQIRSWAYFLGWAYFWEIKVHKFKNKAENSGATFKAYVS